MLFFCFNWVNKVKADINETVQFLKKYKNISVCLRQLFVLQHLAFRIFVDELPEYAAGLGRRGFEKMSNTRRRQEFNHLPHFVKWAAIYRLMQFERMVARRLQIARRLWVARRPSVDSLVKIRSMRHGAAVLDDCSGRAVSPAAAAGYSSAFRSAWEMRHWLVPVKARQSHRQRGLAAL